VVAPSPQQRSALAQDSPRHKKRKDKEHRKDKSRLSPTRLRPLANSGDRAVIMDFLRYDLMVSNRVSMDLDSYEFGPYSVKTSPLDLHTAFLELATRTLLVGRIMGDELMRKGNEGVEKMKADLERSTTSLQSALSTNISLAGRNKDLEEQHE